MAPHRAFLIDGTAFCYRAFYAIRVLSTSDGRPTNAVYGFAMMLNALRKTQHPDELAVAFDVGKPTFRHERFEGYKIQRKPMPETLIAQLPVIKELLGAFRIPVFEREGYEAEDLLATLGRRIAGPGVEVFLVTGDKDALQLVGPHVKVYNPHHDNGLVIDAGAVEERYGVPPDRMVDLMALMGDEIDNIPGVPGIGPKTASALLKQFGTLEQLYGHLEEVPSDSQRAALRTHHQQVELARELARIETDVPIEVTREDLTVREPDWQALRRLYRSLEFKRLLADLETAAPADPQPPVRIHRVEDQAAGIKLAEALSNAKPAALVAWGAGDAGVMALAWKADEAWMMPIGPTWPAHLEPLKHWLGDASHPKLGHDLKAAMRWLSRYGVALEGIAGDTMIAAYVLNPAKADPTLQEAAEDHLDLRLAPVSIPEGDRRDEAFQPAAHAVCAIGPLHERLEGALRAAKLDGLYRDLELPLVRVLAEMETLGVAVDQDLLAEMRGKMDERLSALSEELYTLAGSRFNLNSPRQLAEVLFQHLKLPVVKRTKTGPSTDSEVLQKLAASHPFPKKLIEYRELSKLVSTYVEALPKLIDPGTGRLHTTFHQTGTATGRLSSSDPNLQNIPVKTELGRQIRRAFIPGPRGWALLAADYSQIELRILAHLCGDPALGEAFRQDHDIHRYTASLIYGVPEQEVASEMRSAMKAINYGILYGMSAHGLSKELGVGHEEAAAFIDAYFARYPRVRAFLDAQIACARREGFVQTLLGRRRYIPEVNSPDPIVRQFGERMAVNAPIQGTAADLIKRAMLQLSRWLRASGLSSRMMLQVHDELVFETPPEERETLATQVRDVMEHALELSVPLRVTVKCGPNWLEMTEFR